MRFGGWHCEARGEHLFFDLEVAAGEELCLEAAAGLRDCLP